MVSALAAHPSECGECSLCCKLIGVRELGKLRLQWCEHCAIGKGCKIYEDRPASCREYQCMWLTGQSLPPDQRLPLALKPSVCGAVMFEMGNGMLLVDMDPHISVLPDAIKRVVQTVSFQADVIVRRRYRYTVWRDNNIILEVFNDDIRNDAEIKLEVPERQEMSGSIMPNILIGTEVDR